MMDLLDFTSVTHYMITIVANTLFKLLQLKELKLFETIAMERTKTIYLTLLLKLL